MDAADRVRGCLGCAMFFALVTGLFDTDQGHQTIAAVFGATYGGIWINHE